MLLITRVSDDLKDTNICSIDYYEKLGLEDQDRTERATNASCWEAHVQLTSLYANEWSSGEDALYRPNAYAYEGRLERSERKSEPQALRLEVFVV